MIFYYKESKESKSKKKKKFDGGWVGGGRGCWGLWGAVGGGGVDGRTENRLKPICPFNFFEVGGITMHKCTSYGPDKLTL